MFEKFRIKKQIKVIRQRILFMEQKRARSQAALVDAILKKVDPSDEDVEYFNQFTGEIERLRSLDASRYAEATGEYRRKVAELAAEIEKRDKGISRLKRRRGELIGQVRELADECARLRSELANATLDTESVVRAEQAEANDANAAQVGHDAGDSGCRYHIIRDGMMHMVVEGSGLKGTDVVESVEEPDTREKLEADVTTYLIDSVATWTAHRHALNEEVLRWLDRQASITERDMLDEMQHVFVPDPADITKRDERIAELEAEREQWRAAYGAVMDGIFELQRFGRLMPDETVTGQGDARRMPSDG